jgi:hypothetical protein
MMSRVVPGASELARARHGLGKEVAATVSCMTAALTAVAKAATESQ